jgi:hypothetical protein
VLVACFDAGFGEKRDPVLMLELIRNLIQEGCESNWRLEALEISFASGRFGELR